MQWFSKQWVGHWTSAVYTSTPWPNTTEECGIIYRSRWTKNARNKSEIKTGIACTSTLPQTKIRRSVCCCPQNTNTNGRHSWLHKKVDIQLRPVRLNINQKENQDVYISWGHTAYTAFYNTTTNYKDIGK
jgi:hypothetical protein